jgi:hypothetical protein
MASSFGLMVLLSGRSGSPGGQLVAGGVGSRKPPHRSNLAAVDAARNHVKELFIRIPHWDGNVEEFRFPEYAHVNLGGRGHFVI